MNIHTTKTVTLSSKERAFISSVLTTASYFVDSLRSTEWDKADTERLVCFAAEVERPGGHPIMHAEFTNDITHLRSLSVAIAKHDWTDDEAEVAVATARLVEVIANFYLNLL